MLSALRALLGTRVHSRNELPSARSRVRVPLRLGIEAGRAAFARVKFVNLRTTRAPVPRIRVDLFDRCGASEVDPNSPAVRALAEEKILRRLIPVAGNTAIVKSREVTAVSIALAIHDGDHGFRRGIRFRRWRHVLEFEPRSSVFTRIAFGDHVDLRDAECPPCQYY